MAFHVYGTLSNQLQFGTFIYKHNQGVENLFKLLLSYVDWSKILIIIPKMCFKTVRFRETVKTSLKQKNVQL